MYFRVEVVAGASNIHGRAALINASNWTEAETKAIELWKQKKLNVDGISKMECQRVHDIGT